MYNKELIVNYQLTRENSEKKIALQLPLGKYTFRIEGFETYKGENSLFQKTGQYQAFAKEPLFFDIQTTIEKFVLEVHIADLENKAIFHDILDVDWQKKNHPQNIILKKQDNSLIFNDFIKKGSSIFLTHNDTTVRQFQVKLYQENYLPAPPPFIEGTRRFNPNSRPTATSIIPVGSSFTAREKGLYFIQADTNTAEGQFFNVFDDDYPNISSLVQLISANRYITTNKEYKELTEAEDKKLALDEYWLARSSSKERARKLIRTFYNRIQEANQYFTSYKEGWKTDRGMIYTIFGEPDEVEKYPDFEFWYYKVIDYRRGVSFIFDKEQGEFILRRSRTLELPWMEQIHLWRQGIVP